MLCSILPQPNLMHVRLIISWPAADPRVGKNEAVTYESNLPMKVLALISLPYMLILHNLLKPDVYTLYKKIHNPL